MADFIDRFLDTWEKAKKSLGVLRDVDDLARELGEPDKTDENPDPYDRKQEEGDET